MVTPRRMELALKYIERIENDLYNALPMPDIKRVFDTGEYVQLTREARKKLFLHWAKHSLLQNMYPNPFDYVAEREDELWVIAGFDDNVREYFCEGGAWPLKPHKRYKVFRRYIDSHPEKK